MTISSKSFPAPSADLERERERVRERVRERAREKLVIVVDVYERQHGRVPQKNN